MNDVTPPGLAAVLAAGALEQAPFAALICRPDAGMTLVWRNEAHAVMSNSSGIEIAGKPMFEAFPPNERDGGDAAVEALRMARDRLIDGAATVDIGPYRFDLPGKNGTYVEHHWQIQMSPIHEDGRLVAILQVAQDVTHRVLAQRLADTHKRATRVAAGVSYFSYDPETDRFVRGEEVDALFGFAPDEAGSQAAPFFERIAPEYLDGVHAEVARVMAAPRGEIASFDYRIDRPDGTQRFVRIRGEVATDPHDRRPRLVGTFVDLTDIEASRRKLEDLVEMKEALLAEANHRIKNSLQMALSMLRLEASHLRNDAEATIDSAIAAMATAESRIRSVASIHGMMRLGDSVARVDLDRLLADLVTNTRDSVGMEEQAVLVSGPAFGRSVDSDSAIVFGLIVNELLTNAIKYGWTAGSDGTIRVTRDRDGDRGVLTVENTILDRSDRSMAIASSGLGGELVEGFIAQIDGTLERQVDETCYRVRLGFPL